MSNELPKIATTETSPETEELVLEKIERTPEEIRQLKEKIRFVAKNLSGVFDLRIMPGKGWAASLSEEAQAILKKDPKANLAEIDPKLLIPTIITYPEDDLITRDEESIWAVLRHEIGHVLHTDYTTIIDGQRMAEEEGYNPNDMHLLTNAWEDARVNEHEARNSETSRARMITHVKNGLKLVLSNPLAEKPKPIQFGLISLIKGNVAFVFEDQGAYQEIIDGITDEEVLACLEETEDSLMEFVPHDDGRKACEDILWKKVWPVFKKLIDKHIEEDAKEKHKKDQKQNTESDPSQPQTPDSGDSQENTNGEQTDWDNLTSEEKQKYIDQAREDLNREEAEIIKLFQPQSLDSEEKEDGTIEMKMNPVNPEDVAREEIREMAEEEKETRLEQQRQRAAEEERRVSKEAMDKLKERQTGLNEWQRREYEDFRRPIKKYERILVDRLDEIFPETTDSEWEGGHRRGKRIDTRRMAREIPINRGRFFERKEQDEIKEAAFTLLVDISGSMRGEKIRETIKAAILMAEAFTKKGVPFEIIAFNANIVDIKKFDEPYSGKIKLKLMDLLNKITEHGSGRTDAGFAVDLAARRLQERFLANEAQGALIALTDGSPSPTFEHSGPEWDLDKIVAKWRKKIPLVGVGIGPRMEQTIKTYFDDNGIAIPEVEKLPRELLKILSRQLARFEQRNPSGG